MARGRGITDSTLAKWVHALPRCVPTCDELDSSLEYTLVHQSSIKTYIKVPGQDTIKDRCISCWMAAGTSPFAGYETNCLVSFSTGMVAGSSVNCD